MKKGRKWHSNTKHNNNNYWTKTKDLHIVESELSNLADSWLIVGSHVWGGGQNTLHSAVINTDVNTQGKSVTDASG